MFLYNLLWSITLKFFFCFLFQHFKPPSNTTNPVSSFQFPVPLSLSFPSPMDQLQQQQNPPSLPTPVEPQNQKPILSIEEPKPNEKPTSSLLMEPQNQKPIVPMEEPKPNEKPNSFPIPITLEQYQKPKLLIEPKPKENSTSSPMDQYQRPKLPLQQHYHNPKLPMEQDQNPKPKPRPRPKQIQKPKPIMEQKPTIPPDPDPDPQPEMESSPLRSPNPPPLSDQPLQSTAIISMDRPSYLFPRSPISNSKKSILPPDPSPPPPPVIVVNRSMREELAVVTKVDPAGDGFTGNGDVEGGGGGGGGGDQRPRAVSSILLRERREAMVKRAALGFRVCSAVFCLISFSVMAADKTQGWAGDSFDRYTEYRYCLSVAVIGFAYAGFQAFNLAYHLITGKHVIKRHIRYFFDFAMDQILAYLLISAASAGSSRVDEWQSNFGKDEFTEMASASIGMSFLAFTSFAFSSLISGYTLCIRNYT